MNQVGGIFPLLTLIQGQRFQNYKCWHVCVSHNIYRQTVTVQKPGSNLPLLIPVVDDSRVLDCKRRYSFPINVDV
ncbi:hypothetical protein ALP26_00325 [Pseudomonas savastanoi pv. glycinea]|nr:hypothetical protein ALQ67_00417 [Pseudomonas savastanoi pv. glycinea]RMN36609.1 hypothetical protein ALQ66_03202 [Pseudomonas savastanoi pv. glycinea]RMU60930.1 hypothetical protein ALP26_00325 [Pseudomonas savastanoi pv. glycinea]